MEKSKFGDQLGLWRVSIPHPTSCLRRDIRRPTRVYTTRTGNDEIPFSGATSNTEVIGSRLLLSQVQGVRSTKVTLVSRWHAERQRKRAKAKQKWGRGEHPRSCTRDPSSPPPPPPPCSSGCTRIEFIDRGHYFVSAQLMTGNPFFF